MSTAPLFRPGHNIAMKVPPHQYEATLRFYRDVLKLEDRSQGSSSVRFAFGDKTLWIDRVPALSQAEIWLEIVTRDIDQAARVLAAEGVVRCDDIEPLPDGMAAFWISSPAAIVHLVSAPGA